MKKRIVAAALAVGLGFLSVFQAAVPLKFKNRAYVFAAICLLFLAFLGFGMRAEAADVAIPTIKSILAGEDGSIIVKWNKVSGAVSYEVARLEEGKREYKFLGNTERPSYKDTTGTPKKTYTYIVRAITPNGNSLFCPGWKKTVRSSPERIAYIGDSVMSGFDVYGILADPRERAFAKVSRRISMVDHEDLPEVLSYLPDRAYIMVGTNDCVGNISDAEMQTVLVDYYDMVDRLCASNPSIEIIIMGIGPTRSETLDNGTVQRFNNLLQKMVGEREFLYYYDTGKTLRDSEGMLKAEYASQDGIHWSKGAYEAVYGDLLKYSKKL